LVGKTLGHYEILAPLGDSMYRRDLHERRDDQRGISLWQTWSWILLSLLIATSAGAQSGQGAEETPYVVRFGSHSIEIGEPEGSPMLESDTVQFYGVELMLEITAAGGYEQTVQLRLTVRVPTGRQ